MSSNVASFRWVIPPSVIAKNIGSYGERLTKAVVALAQFFAAKIETYAKQNARWTDHTSNARQGLTATVLPTAVAVTIILFHQASYGIWLEVKNAGRFAIILKALETHYPQIMAALNGLMGGR
jgi:hypothetical protein